jgi:hypothetical protein
MQSRPDTYAPGAHGEKETVTSELLNAPAQEHNHDDQEEKREELDMSRHKYRTENTNVKTGTDLTTG